MFSRVGGGEASLYTLTRHGPPPFSLCPAPPLQATSKLAAYTISRVTSYARFLLDVHRFSVNMGTGIVSLLLRTAPHKFHGMADIGTGFYFLNIALFVVFTTLSIAR